jgi:hypothetical protein
MRGEDHLLGVLGLIRDELADAKRLRRVQKRLRLIDQE